MEEVAQAHNALVLRVQALEEALPALQAAHERLRGRFYALRGPDPGGKTKAQILAEHFAKQGR